MPSNPFIPSGGRAAEGESSGARRTRKTSNPFIPGGARAAKRAEPAATGGVAAKVGELNNLTDKAEDTGDESLWDRAKNLADPLMEAGGTVVGETLNLLDTGRAAVVAGGIEALDLLGGNIEQTDRVQQSGVSLDDFLANVRNHVGVGDVLEADPATRDLPINAKRALGFVGDVGLDPLSYVTFGAASVAREGGEQVVRGVVPKRDIQRRLLAAADEGRISREAAEEAVERVQLDGPSVLPEDLAEAIGVRTGAQFGVGRTRVTIPGTRQLGEDIANTLTPARRAVRGAIDNTPWLSRAAEALEVVPGLRAMRRTPGGAVRAFQVEEAWRGAQEAGLHVGQTLKRELLDIHTRHGEVDADALRRAMEGDEVARQAVADAWRELSDWFERARVQAELRTGKRIPKFVDYLPHQASADLREHLAGKRGTQGRRPSPDITRGYKAGDEFMGETLQSGTIDELNEIASAKLGRSVKVFATDPWAVSATYANHLDWLVRQQGFVEGLRRKGLVEHFDLEAFKRTRKAQNKVARQTAKARRDWRKSVTSTNADADAPISPSPVLDDPEAVVAAEEASMAAQAASERALRANVAATEAVEQLDAAAATPTTAFTEPPVPEGHVRLYRGEGSRELPPTDDAGQTGQYFTPDREVADSYGGGNALLYVDLPADQLEQYHYFSDMGIADEYLIPRELADRAIDAKTGLPPVPGRGLVKSAEEEVAAARAAVEEAKGIADPNAQAGKLREEWQRRQLSLDTSHARLEGVLRTQRELHEEAANIRAAGEQRPALASVLDEPLDVADEATDLTRTDPLAALDEERHAVWEREQAVAAKLGNPDLTDDAKAALKAEHAELRIRLDALSDERSAMRGNRGPALPSVERKNGRRLLPPEAQERLEGINAELARLNHEQGVLTTARNIDLAAQKAIVDEVKRLREGKRAVITPAQHDAAVAKLKEATKRLRDEEKTFNAARAAYEGAVNAQSENLLRLVELEEIAEVADLKARLAAREEQVLRRRAEELYRAATEQPDPDLAAIARIEAMAEQTSADAVAARLEFGTLKASHFFDANSIAALGDILDRGLRQLNDRPDMWASEEIADAIVRIQSASAPKQVGTLLRAYDVVMSRWKAYALLYPGFHFRNWFGGMFNNSLAGVDLSSYTVWHNAIDDIRRAKAGRGMTTSQDIGSLVDKVRDPRIREAMRSEQFQGSVLDETHVRDIADMEAHADRAGIFSRKNPNRRKFDPTSIDFAPITLNRKGAQLVERQLRAPLFIDRYLKTGSLDEAADAVRKYHFDYSELSQAELSVGRRLMPFYTWTRKNVPLQLEMIVRQPGRYTRYLHAKRNIELGTGEGEWVPSYYNDLLAIRTPFKTGEDANVYLTPDLPFVGLSEVLEPRQLVSSLTPAITTPLQLMAKRQFYSDIPFRPGLAEAPDTWKPLMPILALANGKLGLPRVTRSNGTWFLSESDSFKIEQTWPLLGRLRRIFPSEERYQNRAMTTYLSTLGGIGSRTLDSGAQYGEVARRVDILKGMLADYASMNPTEYRIQAIERELAEYKTDRMTPHRRELIAELAELQGAA